MTDVILCLIWMLIGVVGSSLFWALWFKIHTYKAGSLILLDDTEEGETYAFMELNTPIANIRDKKNIHLKVQKKSQN